MTFTTFGRYEIKNMLGQGGMAEVYTAYDPVMERLVALKIIRTKFSQDARFKERFWREAKTIGRLEHRAILPVHDFGEDEVTGQLYLVMRLMPDVLHDWLKRNKLIPLEDTSLNRCSECHHFIWIYTLVWLFAEKILYRFYDGRHTGLTTDQDNFVNIFFLESRRFKCALSDLDRLVDKFVCEFFKFGTT